MPDRGREGSKKLGVKLALPDTGNRCPVEVRLPLVVDQLLPLVEGELAVRVSDTEVADIARRGVHHLARLDLDHEKVIFLRLEVQTRDELRSDANRWSSEIDCGLHQFIPMLGDCISSLNAAAVEPYDEGSALGVGEGDLGLGYLHRLRECALPLRPLVFGSTRNPARKPPFRPAGEH
jgi:hypothetical protein